jgi:hypothetical protein
MEMSGELHAAATVPSIPIGQRLSGLSSRTGCGSEHITLLLLPGIEPQASVPFPNHCIDRATSDPQEGVNSHNYNSRLTFDSCNYFTEHVNKPTIDRRR